MSMSEEEELPTAYREEDTTLASRGSRGSRNATAAAADKFARMRERRRLAGSSSSRRLAEYSVNEQEDIYDEVTEEHYKAIVKGRLKEEDFVIDDDGRGYAENGLEEWDDHKAQYSSGSEVEERRKADRKDGKRKRKTEKVDKLFVKPEHQIRSYFQRGARNQLTGNKKLSVSTHQEDQFMTGLLEELDEKVEPIPKKVKKEPEAQSNDIENAPEDDGVLRMYWIDAVDKQGTVYLFGKILNSETKGYVSCCVVVHNVERNVFILPRRHKVDAAGNDTGIPVAMDDVFHEFDQLRKKFKITEWLSKEVKRNYAFEIDDVPRESHYLKVVYKYNLPQLPHDLAGETFSHLFGTNTSALEQFLLKKKLMGPGWLEIKGSRLNQPNISWAKVEYVVDDPKLVRRLSDVDGTTMTKDTPPMNIVSMSLRTAMNSANKNEIMIASAILYENVRIDQKLDFRKMPCRKYTVVRQPSDRPLPAGFQDLCRQQNFPVEVVRSERTLLSYLVALFTRTDPDVIISHNFVSFDLSVLLARMKEQKVEGWSRLGRLRRHQWPQLASVGDTNYATKAIVSGRLICDTYLQAKDLITSKNYKLGELASSQLSMPRDDIDYEKIIHYFGTASDLHGLASHCCYDAFLAMGLACHLQALPLTKELTCLAGNLWSKTLLTGRAERNEMLLLHEFHVLKYICPDKTFGMTKGGASRPLLNDNHDEEDANGPTNKADGRRRKPAYAGGLVLEPKKGLYDKFVLLLDFNSLYPSIIQEYNICFTSVKRTAGTAGLNEVPDVPDSSAPTGVLPKLLKSLVERRRNIKNLMKHRDTTPTQMVHYDIVQKALKLTANSMYGCLGFPHSRFYAKQLAMLITSKGREILQNTVDLAEKQRLEVIYGDTDSIMINTNSVQLEEVKRIGEEFKREVNKRYRLLEIETDGVFQRMLLLKKKKYAALVMVEKGGRLEVKTEMKGLDMVRRDWCELSKDVSNYVLNEILTGENRDAAVESIHQHLGNVAEEVRKSSIPLEKFVINKSLSKAPEHYADKSSQPHVTVALQMKARGHNVQVGETIPYVICEEEGSADQKPHDSSAARAHHPDDLRKADTKLKIDAEWYLNNQLHPPVVRLLEPIDGTDAVRIAHCLGLDPSRFRALVAAAVRPVEGLHTLDSQMPDEERFKDVERFTPSCRYCGQKGEVVGVTATTKVSDATATRGLTCGLDCPNPTCGKARPVASLEWQLICAIRRHIQRYNGGWLVCDDSACRTRTRMMSVYGRRCLQGGCHGAMMYEYSDDALYTQLRYYEFLFDVDRAKAKAEGTADADAVRRIAETRRDDFVPLYAAARRYMDQNARGYVDLRQLFSFCQI